MKTYDYVLAGVIAFVLISSLVLITSFVKPNSPIIGKSIEGVSSSRTVYVLADKMTLASSDNQITYFHNDLLGSSALRTDSIASINSAPKFEPFGNSVIKGISYTNKVSNTYSVNLGARDYDPDLGRFIVPDPIIDDRFGSYTYVQNNPLSYNDLDGRDLNDALTFGKSLGLNSLEVIKNIPAGIRATVQDPSILLDVPAEMGRAARGSFPEGSLWGFGTSASAEEGGRNAANFLMPLVMTGLGAQIKTPPLPKPALVTTVTAEGLMFPQLIIVGEVSTSGSAATFGGLGSTVMFNNGGNDGAENKQAKIGNIDGIRQKLRQAGSKKQIDKALKQYGLKSEHSGSDHFHVTDMKGVKLRLENGAPITFSASPSVPWRVVGDNTAKGIIKAKDALN